MTQKPISEPTMKSLLLTMLWERPEDRVMQTLATGTGFIVERKGRNFLITNLHNLRGQTPSGDMISSHGVRPTHIQIAASNWMFSEQGRVQVVQPLYVEPDYEIDPLWWQHPQGSEFDVAALEITQFEGEGRMLTANGFQTKKNVTASFPSWKIPGPDNSESPRPYLRPADTVSIVGFPFGFKSQHNLPLWITGTIASEPEFNHDNKPIFLVDARTRPGQSGSPVVLHMTPNTPSVLFTDYSIRTYNRETSFFLGIYSGRLNVESDIGIVWKTEVIRALLQHGVRVSSSGQEKLVDVLKG